MIDYRVYLVTDNPSRYRGDWLENVRAAVEGGVTCVQYRDTESAPREQYARIRQLQDALRTTSAALIVNNDAELAAAVQSDGVHVGQGDLAPKKVRQVVGDKIEIGLSITSEDQVAEGLRLVRSGFVDCFGIGPVFDARKTKADASPALGVARLRAIVSQMPDIPNCAIGGITRTNAAEVLSAGARGLAVVSAFSQSEDPYVVARDFALLFDHCRK